MDVKGLTQNSTLTSQCYFPVSLVSKNKTWLAQNNSELLFLLFAESQKLRYMAIFVFIRYLAIKSAYINKLEFLRMCNLMFVTYQLKLVPKFNPYEMYILFLQ